MSYKSFLLLNFSIDRIARTMGAPSSSASFPSPTVRAKQPLAVYQLKTSMQAQSSSISMQPTIQGLTLLASISYSFSRLNTSNFQFRSSFEMNYFSKYVCSSEISWRYLARKAPKNSLALTASFSRMLAIECKQHSRRYFRFSKYSLKMAERN